MLKSSNATTSKNKQFSRQLQRDAIGIQFNSYGNDGTFASILWDFYQALGCHDTQTVLNNNQTIQPKMILCMGDLKLLSWVDSDLSG